MRVSRLGKSIRFGVCIILLIPAFLGPFAIPQGPCVASHVVINEFDQNPEGLDSGNEWIELYNPTTQDVNVLAWRIETGAGEKQTYQITEATVSAFGFLTITFPSLFLNNVDESITLIDRNGNRVDSTLQVSDTANDQRSWQRLPDGLESGSAWQFMASTRGSSNAFRQAETTRSAFCDLLTRIGLATSSAVMTFVAVLIALPPWKKAGRNRRGTSESPRPYIYLFAILLGLLVFELWERMRIPEISQIEPFVDTIIFIAATISGSGGFAAFLIRRHARQVRQVR